MASASSDVRNRFWMKAALMAAGLHGLAPASSSQVAAQFASPRLPRTIRLYINYSPKPNPADLLAYNLCILDPWTQVDLHPGHRAGNVYLAYVSAVEVSPSSPAAAKAAARGIPVIARNKTWKSDVLDVTHPEWSRYLLEDVIQPALAKGFDGVFLDTLDSVQSVIARQPAKAREVHQAMAKMIRDLRASHPGALVVTNRGFEWLREVGPCLNAVLLEGLFQSWNFSQGVSRPVSDTDTEWLMQHIHKIQAMGLPVLVVDYVSPDQPDLAGKTAERIVKLGCIPLVTTPELNGQVLAPPISSEAMRRNK